MTTRRTAPGGSTAATRLRVLVVDGSGGQAHGPLGAVRALSVAGHEVHLAHASPASVAARSRHVAQRLRVPGTEETGFADAVRALLAAGRYDACFPTSDAALVALDWPGADLVDKTRLRARMDAAGIPAPESADFATGAALLEAADDLHYPLAVKPALNEGPTFEAFRADSAAGLAPLASFPEEVVVERWLDGEQRAISGVVHRGRLVAVAHQRYQRTWPVECGVACAAVTAEPDEEAEAQVLRLLEGYDGIFQCQSIDGVLHDVNPRVFGSVLLAQRAGVNLPAVAARLAAEGPGPLREPLRAEVGVRYRWVEGELKNLGTSLRRGDADLREVLRRVRPHRGTAHSDVWISDPAPSLARVRHVARRVRGAR